MSHHRMTPLGRTVRLGNLVLGEHGAIDVGGTRLPAGVRIEDCTLGTGADRAILSRTPEGRVTVRHRGETLTYAWDPGEGRWYGPGPDPMDAPRGGPLRPGTRVLLAALAVAALAWMLPRAGSRTPPPADAAEQIVTEAGADAYAYGGEQEDPLAGFVDEFEAALEYGELGRQEVALSAEQEERLADFFAAQARVARLLEEEVDAFRARMFEIDLSLGDLRDDQRLPFELRRGVARLTDPGLDQRTHDISAGMDGIGQIAARADWQAGRALRHEAPFTLADAQRGLDDQAALEAALDHVKTHHDLLDALLPEIPARLLALRGVFGEDDPATFVTLFAVDEEVLYDEERSDELDRLLGRIARPDHETRRLIAGYVARTTTLPHRMERIAGDLARCRREAETLFAPMLAESGVTPR